MEASLMAFDAYATNFQKYRFGEKGFPKPEHLKNILAKNSEDAILRLHKAAMSGDDEPLYVLIWGNMFYFGKALKQHPEIKDKIRLITIGTGLKYGPEDEVAGKENVCLRISWMVASFYFSIFTNLFHFTFNFFVYLLLYLNNVSKSQKREDSRAFKRRWIS